MASKPLRAATNADVQIEVWDKQETTVTEAFLYASFFGSIEHAEATLTLTPPKLPPILGTPHIPSSLPFELPLVIHLHEARFTRMHELNSRRAEININCHLYGRNVHVTLTTNPFQDGLQAEMLDEIYFKALVWYRNLYPTSLEPNQFAYHRLHGDSTKVDVAKLLNAENDRTKRTLRAIARYPKPEPPIIKPVRRIYDRLLALNDLARATIIAIANLHPFKEFVQDLAVGATVDTAPVTMQLLECFNDSPLINPSSQLLAVLKKSQDGTAIGMIEQLCKTLDSEASASGKTVKSDRNFVLRVVNKRRCERCGRAPSLKNLGAQFAGGIDETPLRRPFVLLHPEPPNELAVSTPVSLIQVFKETLQQIVGGEKMHCEHCGHVFGVGAVGMLTNKLPNCLILGVMRGNALRNQVILDEPEWLVLDKLIDNNFNAEGELDLRRTNMSITLPAIAYHAARKAAEEGRTLPRKATYQLASVVRQCNGVSGAEIYQDGNIIRIADGKECERSIRKPNDTELRCGTLLVYKRVNGPESQDLESDDEQIFRSDKTGPQVTRPTPQRRKTINRNFDYTPPPKTNVSAEAVAKLQAEFAQFEQDALLSSPRSMEVDEKPVKKQTRKSRRVGTASDRRLSVEATVSPPTVRRSRRISSNAASSSSVAGGRDTVNRSKSERKIVRPKRSARKKK